MTMHLRRTTPRTVTLAPLAAALALTWSTTTVAADGAAASGSRLPLTMHQRDVLADFKVSDQDRDGALNQTEFSVFAKRREAKSMAASKHQKAVLELDAGNRDAIRRDFKTSDSSADGQVDFIEVYFYETFSRPGVFPPRDDSIPQEWAGHWEAAVRATPPGQNRATVFGSEATQRAVEAGGFSAADVNNDGGVSIFEANDHSMLLATHDIYQFEFADLDSDWMLSETEFGMFRKLQHHGAETGDSPAVLPQESDLP